MSGGGMKPDVIDELGGEVPPLMSPANSRIALNTKFETNSDSSTDKICKVCGDRAVGYNFGIISCESCKAFFRRNASRASEIICAFSNACEINKISRKYCQSCRLQKCLKEGMMKDWLVGEKLNRKGNTSARNKRNRSLSPTMEELEKKVQGSKNEVSLSKQVLQSLIKRARQGNSKSPEPKTRCTCSCLCGFYPSNVRLVAEAEVKESEIMKPTSESGYIHQEISQPTIARITSEPFPGFENPNHSAIGTIPHPRFQPNPYPSWYQPPPMQETSYLQEYMACFSNPNQPGPSVPSAFRRYENFIPPDPPKLMSLNDYSFLDTSNRPITNVTDWSLFNTTIPVALSSEDRALVHELIQANHILTMPMNIGARNEGELSLLDVVRISDLAMRRIISMAKKLNMFMSQMQSDQIAILKGSLSELLILRGVMVFDPSQDIWKHQIYTGSKELKITVDILQKTPEQKHYAEHKKFLMSFDDKWRKNENVMLILNAITLFCPDRPNIRDVGKVKACQRRYYDLLKRYLDTQCPETESRQAYDSLLRKLVDLHELNQSLLRIYSHVNPNDLDPLLQELFDMNPSNK